MLGMTKFYCTALLLMPVLAAARAADLPKPIKELPYTTESLLTPAVLLILGLFVAIILLAIYLPLFSMAGVARGA